MITPDVLRSVSPTLECCSHHMLGGLWKRLDLSPCAAGRLLTGSTPLNEEGAMSKTVVLLMAAEVAGALGQSAAQQPAPATPQLPPPGVRGLGSWGPVIRSPEVAADETVTFRLRLPYATPVVVRGMTPQPLPMQKDASDAFSTFATSPAVGSFRSRSIGLPDVAFAEVDPHTAAGARFRASQAARSSSGRWR